MTLGKVKNMEIVADAGAVGCGIVISEHAQFAILDAADGHVREQRQQVAWPALGVFADEARRVRAGRAADA